MIIELPNDSAIESSAIASVRWFASHEDHGKTFEANVVIMEAQRGFMGASGFLSIPCATDEDAQALARRVIDEWKQAAEARAA